MPSLLLHMFIAIAMPTAVVWDMFSISSSLTCYYFICLKQLLHVREKICWHFDGQYVHVVNEVTSGG